VQSRVTCDLAIHIDNSDLQPQNSKPQQQAVLLVSSVASPAEALFSLFVSLPSLPPNSLFSSPHLFLTNLPSGRLFLLSLLRRKVDRQCGLFHQTTTHLPHQIDSKFLTRTKRSAAMAQVHSHQLRGIHSRCQAVCGQRVRGSREDPREARR
jgi:hypothetical protein